MRLLPLLRLLPASAAALVCARGGAAAPEVRVHLEADQQRIGMGRSVTVSARAELPGGAPAAGYLLLPYVNGERWGAHEVADADGRAVWHLPLPNPGVAEVQVEAREQPPRGEQWIWAPETSDQQSVWFQGTFTPPDGVREARLWVAVDDAAQVFLNGEDLPSTGGWQATAPLAEVRDRLRPGANVLSVKATNGAGPAGLLVRLELVCDDRVGVVGTGESWCCFDAEPAGWPGKAEAEGRPVKVLGPPEGALWAGGMSRWPTLHARTGLIAGTRVPEGAVLSDPLRVEVEWRRLQTIPEDPEHLVGMQWEPWFTPLNANWATGQAVPVMGLYWSWDRSVLRQQMIWLIESGVNFLVVDWTNHLWGKEHWDERPDATNEIILCTTLALEVLAELRDEGQYVPKMVLYPGLNNGPETTVQAISEELAWIHHNYVRNPRFAGLFVEYLGKPLVLIHNGAGPGYFADPARGQVDETYFTVRWQSSQLQIGHQNEQGYWSWMDGSLEPMLTLYEGQPEALTVSTAFFAGGGWLGPEAYGHRGGWTYIESFKAALKQRPRFVELHQFNEFAGQPEGQGYGPNHDVYVDSYSVELSDDIEPVSLTAPAYRGDGGWGYLYLNLTRALVDLYRQDPMATTVVAVSRPAWREVVTGDKLEVVWTWAGREPVGFAISLNGRTVAEHLTGTTATVDLRDVPDGPVTLRLTAEGTQARYLLSHTSDSLPLAEAVPAYVEVGFTVKH